MQINVALLETVHTDLNELRQIVGEQKYDEQIVLDKIKHVIENLFAINTIPQVDLDNYLANLKSWNAKLEASRVAHKELIQFTDELAGLADRLIVDHKQRKKTDPELKKKFHAMNWDDQKRDQIERDINFDLGKYIDEILTGHMNINLAAKRRFWLWKSRLLFSSMFVSSSLAKLIISSVVGFVAVLIGQKLFPKVPEIILGLVVGIISFFSLDRWMENQLKIYFWKEVSKEVYVLFIHFKIYLDQIVILRSPDMAADGVVEGNI